MTKGEKRKHFYQKLRNKYRLAIFNEQTYEEVFGIRLSRLNVFTSIGSILIFLIIIVIFLTAFTGLREYIPGYPSGKERRMILRNAELVDSLLYEIDRRDRFIKDIRTIVSGEIPEGAVMNANEDSANQVNSNQSVSFKKSTEDSLFRMQVEQEERFNLSVFEDKNQRTKLEHTFFFTPLKGVIVNKFGDSQRHYGVDIVAAPDARVASVLDGTIVFTGWTVETGYVIQVQHENNLISIYKHNSVLLKEMGDRVKAGEAIAKVGNSGELTTGPHLHFELWYNGAPLNPENHISFN
ncbi:M23 family metallopeptidase [Marinilabiliaceae bacterium JC017]|nr:M23 family metallopeptidase [Marinilabiliaceae bacterium JC017]